ncbi:PEP-CTERM sorting domain-containing protein [Pseudoduganella lutea]|uniref:PEP-CTERM sorting domain-containing protein n=1 Tax=Pseudoduganella lutea TaxID=321985 RepID=A0A4P6KU66_9BURK|nr:PEP-CTERM sorting domain-containing protein [Pseudoduganella lutea]QBE62621.1 PEP-CTERM sorting domain-containing protein [Pseudoduganella lutea]
MNIQKLFRAVLATSALFLGLTQAAQADIVTLTGDTTGGPTYNRTLANLAAYSPNGEGVSYRTHTLTVDTSGDYSFVATGLGFDTFAFLYESSFDPASPLINGLVGNDDAISLNTSGFEATLDSGTTYVFVMTGFDSEQFGAYSVTIAGPGMISAIPEPATWVMLALGIGLLGYTQRRRR